MARLQPALTRRRPGIRPQGKTLQQGRPFQVYGRAQASKRNAPRTVGLKPNAMRFNLGMKNERVAPREPTAGVVLDPRIVAMRQRAFLSMHRAMVHDGVGSGFKRLIRVAGGYAPVAPARVQIARRRPQPLRGYRR